jgi:hypothetical protein
MFNAQPSNDAPITTTNGERKMGLMTRIFGGKLAVGQTANDGMTHNIDSVTKADSVNVSQDKQFNSVTDAGNGNDGTEAYKPLYLAVTQMKEMGVSDSKIIKEVLGHEGRNFKQGQEMLEALLSLGQQHGW